MRYRQVVSRRKAMFFKFTGLSDLDLLVSKLDLKAFDVDEKDGKALVFFRYKKESTPISIGEGQYIVIEEGELKIYNEAEFKTEWKLARGEDE